MNIAGIGAHSAATVQTLVDLRRQLEVLQQQLGTGQKSNTYAGLGLERGLTVGLRGRLAETKAFDSTIANVGVRIQLGQSALSRAAEIGGEVKGAAFQNVAGGASSQPTALAALGEMLGLLNIQAGDRYLFSGRAVDQAATENLDPILNGDGGRAGLRQVIDERRQADLGASGFGRLAVTRPAPTSVRLVEDSATSPFGFKLSAASTTIAGATVHGPSSSPKRITVALAAATPQAGDTVQFRLDLPDGSSETLTLTATASTTPGLNEFTIGADNTATADNLQAAVKTALTKLGDTALTAASAVAAGNDFFKADPPLRVDGPPFDTATNQVDGTDADTVIWYTGERGSDPARNTATAGIDPSIAVSYGVRANEEGIRATLQNVAVLAAMSFSATDPNSAERSIALNRRVGQALDEPPGQQTIADIEADLAGAHTSMAAASERHRQTASTLTDMLQGVEGVSTEEVAAKIMAYQTRLQASLQTTAMLFQMNLAQML